MAIFTSNGRMGRLKFFCVTAVLFVPLLFFYTFVGLLEGIDGQGVFLFLALVVNIMMLFPAAQRLHDIDMSGGYSFVLLIPLVSLVVGLILLLAPGSKGTNRYGPSPVGGGDYAEPVLESIATAATVDKKLEQLRSLYDQGFVDEAVFKQKQVEILKDL